MDAFGSMHIFCLYPLCILLLIKDQLLLSNSSAIIFFIILHKQACGQTSYINNVKEHRLYLEDNIIVGIEF